MSGIVQPGVGIAGILQPNTLARFVGEALFPVLLFRSGVIREPFEAAVGQTMTFTTPGLMEPDTSPRTPGVVPAYKTQDYEHYAATLNSYGWPIKIHMPTSAVTATPTFFNNIKALVMGAAQTMNRLIRDRLYLAYDAGHAIVDAVGGGGTVLTVSSINGFAFSVDPTTGFPVPTSNASPRTFRRNGVAVAGTQIIAATPNDPADPNGAGTITLDNNLAGFVAGDLLDATDASIIIRPNGVPSVDGITAADALNMDLVRQAVTSLRRDNVPPCADGLYHVHMDPFGEAAISRDNSFQRQIETRGLDEEAYLNLAIGKGGGAAFFSNNECPGVDNVGTLQQSRPATAPLARGSSKIGAEVINGSGVHLMRTVVYGGGAIFERFFDEGAYMSEAGVTGKISGMEVQNNGVTVRADGVRFIVKAPTDIFNETVEAAWSWTGDFVPPTNRLTGRSAAAYKCARVIETAIT